MKRRVRWRPLIVRSVAVAMLAASIGCSNGSSPERPIELLVSAAVSLQAGLDAIESEYEAQYRDIDLVMNYGSSGSLQKQIEQGAPADLFVSAGVKQVEQLEAAGLMRDVANLLGNTLVAIASDGTAGITHMEQLPSSGLRAIAIGDPDTVPAGAYAREALTAAGLWEALVPKLVLAKDVRQVTTYVETGNAELGFVYKTDARGSDKAAIAFEIDPGLHAPIAYPAGIVSSTGQPDEAARFLAYLKGEEAGAIFEALGFETLSSDSE